jgi:hypothetical protein
LMYNRWRKQFLSFFLSFFFFLTSSGASITLQLWKYPMKKKKKISICIRRHGVWARGDEKKPKPRERWIDCQHLWNKNIKTTTTTITIAFSQSNLPTKKRRRISREKLEICFFFLKNHRKSFLEFLFFFFFFFFKFF